MKHKYVKRTQYGLDAQIVESTNGSGYYSFKSGHMGGMHNYKDISIAEYLWLVIWYTVLEWGFPYAYKKISKKSYDRGYNSPAYKEHAKKWGIKSV